MSGIFLTIGFLGLIVFVVYVIRGAIYAVKKKEGAKKLFQRSLIPLFASLACIIAFDATADTPKQASSKPKTLDEAVKNIVIEELGEKTNTDKKRIIDIKINNDAGTTDKNDKIVTVKLYADDNLTAKMLKSRALSDSKKVFEKLFQNNEVSKVLLIWEFTLVDKYGSESDGTILRVGIDRQTADKINWENFDYNNFETVAQQYFIHPALNK
ncbi:hypothetical protein ETC03_15720 [Geobacillus sp. MMMUD3]|nr:hypothetical protein [Geobacillus sp. MMMUD3]